MTKYLTCRRQDPKIDKEGIFFFHLIHYYCTLIKHVILARHSKFSVIWPQLLYKNKVKRMKLREGGKRRKEKSKREKLGYVAEFNELWKL